MGQTLAKSGLLLARARLVMLQVVFTNLIIGLILCVRVSRLQQAASRRDLASAFPETE